MANKTKQELLVENNNSFPTNNAGAITATDLRDFNTDLIDSTVNQDVYNTDSASINNSIESLNQFTASQQPTFDALNDFTASQLTINSGYNSTTASLISSVATLNDEVNSIQNWTGSVNEIKDDGVLQGYSTRLHFGGLVSASIVPNVDGAIASINILQDGTKLNTSSFDTYTQSNDDKWAYLGTQSGSWDAASDITPLNEFTASQLTINSGYNNATASLASNISTLSAEVDSIQAWTSSVNQIADDGVVQGYSTRFHFYGNVSASIVPNVGGAIAAIEIPFSGVDTGSLLTTASFDNGTRNLTFTKGDSTTFAVNIPDVSGSVLPSGVVSGSSQVILQDTTGNLSGSRIDGLVVSASYALDSDKLDGFHATKFATTGSNSFNGLQTIDSGNPSTNAIFATQGDIVALLGNINAATGTGSFQHLKVGNLNYAKTDGQGDMFLTTDGANNTSFDWVKTLHQNIHNATTSSIVRGTPLYISGSTGDNANVYFADASNSNRRPATLIAYDATLAPGATGTGIISGEIQGVDTSLYPEGTIVYLGVGGGWTATRPTGSANLVQALGVVTRQANNGRGVVFNQIGNNLPNIQEGYAWVGDSTGVPVAISTGSWGGGGTIDTGSFATTGSNVFVGDQILAYESGSSRGVVFNTKNNSTNDAQFSWGIRPDGQFALTGSSVGFGTNDGLIVVNPDSLWIEVGTQTNFNNTTSFRGFTEVRTVVQEQGFGYEARFDKLVASGSTEVQTFTASLQEGYVWVGDSSGRTTTVSTGSFGGGGSAFPYTGDAQITGSLGVSNTITTQIFINPQTLTGTQTVPTGYNGMLTGPVSNAGTIVIQSGANLVII